MVSIPSSYIHKVDNLKSLIGIFVRFKIDIEALIDGNN